MTKGNLITYNHQPVTKDWLINTVRELQGRTEGVNISAVSTLQRERPDALKAKLTQLLSDRFALSADMYVVEKPEWKNRPLPRSSVEPLTPIDEPEKALRADPDPLHNDQVDQQEDQVETMTYDESATVQGLPIKPGYRADERAAEKVLTEQTDAAAEAEAKKAAKAAEAEAKKATKAAEAEAKKAAKAAKAAEAEAKKAASTGRSRTAHDIDFDPAARIKLLKMECPFRAGSDRAERWSRLRDDMTVAEAKQANMPSHRLGTLVELGYIEVK